MSHPSPAELGALAAIADDVREGVQERGYRILAAASMDLAFDNGRFTKLGRRNLVEDIAATSASVRGMDFRSVGGAGFELRWTQGVHDRRYRIRNAKLKRNGEIVIRANKESTLGVFTQEPLFIEEQWVFAWRATALDCVAEIWIAEVLGKSDGRPGKLRLGTPILLNSSKFPSGGFIPSDEGLDFGDEEDLGDDASGATR